MQTNKCRVCGSDFFKEPLLLYANMPRAAQFMPDAKSLANDKGIDLEVWQCSACGLVQLNNDPVPYFREVIRAAAFSGEMKDFRLRQFRDFVEKYSLRGKKIVEIGCGCGEYLSLMQEAGAEAYGLEYAEEAVQQCRKNGLRVAKGFVQDSAVRLPGAPFDAFFILNFLEHLPDPTSTLRGIANNLENSAVGLVEVPNFDMILRKRLFSEFISDHLFYFTEETLGVTLGLSGFEVVDSSVVWHDYIISAVVQKRSVASPQSLGAFRGAKRLDMSDFKGYRNKLKNEIEKYIRSFGEQRVAIWGAGHQALAVMALTGLASRVRYVVDSAPFKQGKLTPATHIPIVSPQALDSDPVDAIIVMAASYSDEVVKIIRKRLGSRIGVAVLRDFGLEIV